MRLFRPCFIAGCLYPEGLFRIKTIEKLLFLTFDDGPDPGSTPRLLDILDRFDIKAMFFCDGRAAEKYPALVDLIKSKGHLIGNHGYNHLNGWTTPVKNYIADIERGARFTSSAWFRPPYGRISPAQYKILKNSYKIVFWDIMPYDFDNSFAPADTNKVLLRKMRPGSIIVLHDQPGSSFIPYLSGFIEICSDRNYRFVVPDSII
jgi:peptidoglycan-N-acetylglucosamine deacetylase